MENEFYKAIIQKSPIGYAYHKIICNEEGIPFDYEFIEVNLAFEKLIGVENADLVGKRVTDVIPGIEVSDFVWIKTYGELAMNGGSKEFEQFSNVLNRWFRVNVYSPEKYYFITWFTDITQEIRGVEEKSIMLSALSDIIFELDEAYIFRNVIVSDDSLLFLPRESILDKTIYEILPEEITTIFREAFEKVKKSGQKEYIKYRAPVLGEIKWFEAGILYKTMGSFDKKYIVSISEITAEMKLEEELLVSRERFDIALNGTRAGLWDWDMLHNTLYYSAQWKSMLGYEEFEVEPTFYGWRKLWHPEDVSKIEKAMDDYFLGKMMDFEVDYRLRSKSGEWRWILSRGEILRDSTGQPYRWVGTNIDITKMKVAEGTVRYLSFHDQLTGLYNRRFYEEEVVRVDTERNMPLSLVMADINGLKLANDAFGHLVGDALLRKTAELMKSQCRTDEIISRVGGDEFTIVLPKTSYEKAELLVERINEALQNEKVELLDLSISFGVATKLYPEQNIEDVFKKAEERMYQQKMYESPQMRLKTIDTIISMVHKKFPHEKENSEKVSRICELLGIELKFSNEEIKVIKTAGLLHSIGKISLNETIIFKPGSLNEVEWNEVKRLVDTGYRILNSVNEMAPVARYTFHQHEHWDGSGYPDGLKGEEIPIQSRIIGIADAYVAMLCERSYRKVYSQKQAIEEIMKNAGSQFDPSIVRMFVEKIVLKL